MTNPAKSQWPSHLRSKESLGGLFGEYESLEEALLAHAEVCKDSEGKPLSWNDWRKEITAFATCYES